MTEADAFAIVAGAVLCCLRDARGLSQTDLCTRANVLTQATLSRVERGAAGIDVWAFRQMARPLGLSPASLSQLVESALSRFRDSLRSALRIDTEIDWSAIPADLATGLAKWVARQAVAESSAMLQRGCAHEGCTARFDPSRPDQRFCSDAHRAAAWRRQNKAEGA